jgi:serine/threonine-protein kinase
MAADERRARDTLHDASTATLSSDGVSLAALGVPDREIDTFGDLAPGKTLGGRYRIDAVIGRGATGVVFEASHLVIGKRVALKCLYPQHSSQRNAVERFFREARIAATVEHPNVIQVFDGGTEGEVLFLAMERLEGESLGDKLDRGAMPIDEAVDVFLGIMDGVAAVHDRGVVHRDLKPDNIFLVAPRHGRAGGPKVLDFGISKLKEPGRELTALGTVLGTPFYMAPEQIASTRDVDVRADVYSLGVMLYEALTGELPYGDESLVEIFRRSQKGDAAPIQKLRPDVPIAVVRVVERAMRPEPADRFRTVDDMRSALFAAQRSDTDPGAQHAIPDTDDPRATVRDVMSPFAGASAGVVIENAAPASPARADEPLAERNTLPPRPIAIAPSPMPSATVPSAVPSATVAPRSTPAWVYWALGGAAVLTLFSWALTLVALLT